MPRAVVIEIEETGPGLEGLRRRTSDLERPLEQSRQAWLALGAEEFDLAAWRPPSGPLRPYAAVVSAFGGERDPLGGSGSRLFSSYRGGAGGFTRRTPTSIEFGSSLPYAHVHRGGEGEVRAADAARPFRHRMTRRQRAFLAIRFREQNPDEEYGRPEGDPDRGFTVTPRRPHLTDSPELRTRITAIFSAHVAGREVPERLLSAGGTRA